MTDAAPDDDGRPSDRLIGQTLASRYRIEERLGEGAMGTVYRAKHVKVGRPFAVKVLHKHLLVDSKVTQRFEREAELAGRLRHPNVVGVVDVGETPDGFRYMVMDFAQGSDLATLLAEAPFPPARIIHLVRLMLEGLFHAHEAGLIHRDFKPENVIIERDDHGVEVPRIVDFGIAILREGGDSTSATGRLTTNGLVLGTPHYMAPEQAVADPIDHRIDLFAMGIVVYEMLAGKLPFDGSGAEVARANLLLDPPAIAQRVPYLEVDPLLEAFARRLMAKKRDARPATAKAARELLDLVERDRVAAAAVLGVPVQLATRTNAATEPVSPQRPAVDEVSGAQPSPQPPSAPRPSALEAPPVPRPSREPAVTTDPAAPLPWADDRPPRSRRGLVFAGLAVLALGGGVTAFALGRGDASTPATAPAAPVAATSPAPTSGAPTVEATPPAPVEPGPTPVEATPTPVEATPPAAISEPPPTAVAAPPPKTPPTRPDRARKPPATTPTTKVTPGTPPPAVTVTKPPEPTPAKPPEVTPTKPVAPRATTAQALSVQYTAVGQQLKALGDKATDLWPKYRRIVLNDVIGDQAKRDAAAAQLAEIQRLAATRR